METVYTNAFVKTNTMLHRSNVDDSLSGTTGITVLIKGDHLYVGNVGDSRAVVGTISQDGKLRYGALSYDQTPFRRDERERCKQQGAIIASMDQIEGFEPMHEDWGSESGSEIDESGDPPRLWDASCQRPGCAFTRSLGDAVAEAIGVNAEPELMIWPLTENDKFAIVASDGVFEFLTSQAVVDMVNRYKNPLEAGKAIVAEAYRLWLTYDERTDDITIIIIMFDQIQPIVVSPESMGLIPSASNSSGQAVSEYVASPRSPRGIKMDKSLTAYSRPVRLCLTSDRNRRRLIAADEQLDRGNSASPREYPKSPSDLERIASMVATNFLFVKLEHAKQLQLYNYMKMCIVKADDVIIEEGDVGNEMYVIDAGEFVVYKRDSLGVEKLILEYTTPGSTFGELSLMYSQPRQATVRARTEGKLWSIDRHAFRSILFRNVRGGSGLLEIFKAIPLFEQASFPQVQRLCQTLTEKLFDSGSVVSAFNRSETWVLFLVVSGSITIQPKDKPAITREINTYVLYDEIVALEAEAIATTSVRMVCLPRTAFDDVMGPSGAAALKLEVQKNSGAARSKALIRRVSFVNDPAKFNTTKAMTNRAHFVLETPNVLIGDFGYMGTFRNALTKQSCSIKVIAKEKAINAKMDAGLLNERQILAALDGMCFCLTRVTSIYQDKRVIWLEFPDVYMCDLATANAHSTISNNAKVFYAACIYSAVAALHDNAVLHRFINSSSVFLTDKGVAKLADMQYLKRMDGSKSYTICGDPVYFAPEIVSNQGYDFAADLWAYGMLVYELFEGAPVFASITDETKLFKSISSFNGNIQYTDKTPIAARTFISELLKANPPARLGYGNTKHIRENPIFDTAGKHFRCNNIFIFAYRISHIAPTSHNSNLFVDINWHTLGNGSVGYQTDMVSTVDPNSFFKEQDLQECRNSLFDKF